MTIDQAGRAVVPTPETIIPWRTVAAVEAAPAVVLAIIVLLMTVRLRRQAMGRDQLRSGEE